MLSGPARGIGLAVAERLRDAGYRLSLGGRNTDAIQTMVDSWDVAGAGHQAVSVHHYDAVDNETARNWVAETLAEHDAIDVLINNAGLLEGFGLDDYDEVAFDSMLQVNVKAPTMLTHLTLPHLRRCGHGRSSTSRRSPANGSRAGFRQATP